MFIAETKPIKDPALLRLVQPLNDRCREHLYIFLTPEGDGRVTLTWKCDDTCGKKQSDICVGLNLTPQVKEYTFDSKEHAALFICSLQLNRSDLKSEFRKYLIGQKFKYEEILEIRKVGIKNYAKSKLAVEVGNRLKISAGTVLKYYLYSTCIDVIYDKCPDFALRILLGQTKVSHENTIELSRLMDDEIYAIGCSVIEQNLDRLTLSEIRHEVNWSHIKSRGRITKREKVELRRVGDKPPAITQVPTYDPDAEVNSLCMTIGFWISSMKRVCDNTDLAKITSKARNQLINELTLLSHSVSSLQAALVERITDE